MLAAYYTYLILSGTLVAVVYLLAVIIYLALKVDTRETMLLTYWLIAWLVLLPL